MARGDFGRAFGNYRKQGGQVSRKEFAQSDWKVYLPEIETNEVVSDDAQSGKSLEEKDE